MGRRSVVPRPLRLGFERRERLDTPLLAPSFGVRVAALFLGHAVLAVFALLVPEPAGLRRSLVVEERGSRVRGGRVSVGIPFPLKSLPLGRVASFRQGA